MPRPVALRQADYDAALAVLACDDLTLVGDAHDDAWCVTEVWQLGGRIDDDQVSRVRRAADRAKDHAQAAAAQRLCRCHPDAEEPNDWCPVHGRE